MHKLLKKQGFAPEVLVTGKPRSPGEAKTEIGLSVHQEQGLRTAIGRPRSRRRERKIQRFKIARISSALSVHHAAIQNNFHVSHHLASRRALDLLRDEAYPTWRPFTRSESELGPPNCARPNSLEVKAG
jgi:putative transposase